MLALFLLLALLLVLVGHAFRLLRWEQFIRIYERPPRGQMLRGMAGGYALNFVLPFHLGDAFRAVYTGRRRICSFFGNLCLECGLIIDM